MRDKRACLTSSHVLASLKLCYAPIEGPQTRLRWTRDGGRPLSYNTNIRTSRSGTSLTPPQCLVPPAWCRRLHCRVGGVAVAQSSNYEAIYRCLQSLSCATEAESAYSAWTRLCLQKKQGWTHSQKREGSSSGSANAQACEGLTAPLARR